MSLALLCHYLILNIFWMLIRPASGDCNLFVELFHGCIVPVRCVLVLRCGLAGVVWCGIRIRVEVVSWFILVQMFGAGFNDICVNP